jgi:glycosyltransferase involved in cell wall biosynthesis
VKYAIALRRSFTGSDRYKAYIEAGIAFNKKVLRHAAAHESKFTGIYAWNTAALELFQAYKGKKHLVLEQCIVPFRIEHQLLEQERSKFPIWEEQPPETLIAHQYMEREEKELELADVILSPSTFVTESLVKVNPDWASKIRLVPYGVRQTETIIESKPWKEPMHILFVGKVNLRKGVPYIIEAAIHLKGKAVFKIVGDYSDLSPAIIEEARKHVELIGAVNRDQVSDYYRWADIFLLPSICEGSATVTYEAMQFGLPMLVTPNTGSLIRDGYGGFILRPGNAWDIVQAITNICEDPDVLTKFHQDILELKSLGTYNAYKDRLTPVVNAVEI